MMSFKVGSACSGAASFFLSVVSALCSCSTGSACVAVTAAGSKNTRCMMAFFAAWAMGKAASPGSGRDSSLDVPAALRHADIIKAVESAKQKLLVDCRLKDVFCDPTGEKLPADRKAMTYTFLYRDAKKTLTAAEVDAAHKQVLDTLAAKIKDLRFR